MILPLYGHLALPFGKSLRLDGMSRAAQAVAPKPQPWALPLRQRTALLPPVHSLLADADGVWSWAPDDAHAAATRHHNVHHWIEQHPGCDMRLWVASNLLENLGSARSTSEADEAVLRSDARDTLVQQHGEHAAQWPLASWKSDRAVGVCALAGIDLAELTRCAKRLGVRVRSVVPWWYHAFLEAKRCLAVLAKANNANVCIVEGRQIAWVTTANGQLTDIRQATLESASVAALGDAIRVLTEQAGSSTRICVVLGQGLVDGARTQALDALVLGRLDGEQPPQWLRPSDRTEVH